MSNQGQKLGRTFKGEGDLLLDALVQACQTTAKPLLPGFGRSLVPFDFNHEADEQPSPSRVGSNSPKEPRPKARSGSAKHPRQVKSASTEGHRKRQAVRPAAVKEAVPKSKLAKAAASVPFTPVVQTTPVTTAGSPEGRVYAVSPAITANKWAGSSVYNSAPRPEALPMPNDALLSPFRPRSVDVVATSGLKSLLQISVAA